MGGIWEDNVSHLAKAIEQPLHRDTFGRKDSQKLTENENRIRTIIKN